MDVIPESTTPVTARAVPLAETCVYTCYQTAVFDAIQNYRGLPMFDMLSEASRQFTVKMSLSTLDRAVPRDDPQFVIWGDVSNNGGIHDIEKESLQGAPRLARGLNPAFSRHIRRRKA